MSKENLVTFGLENVHIAFEKSTGKWELPIHIPGAVSFTPSADGSQANFDADNITYFTLNSNNGYTADLTLALIPEKVLISALGWEKDDNGAVIEIADGKPKKFALMFQVEGDEKNRRMVYYSCLADRPAKENQTKGASTQIVGEILSLKINPIEINNKKIVKGHLEYTENNKVAYDAFFNKVYVPTFSVSAPEDPETPST